MHEHAISYFRLLKSGKLPAEIILSSLVPHHISVLFKQVCSCRLEENSWANQSFAGTKIWQRTWMRLKTWYCTAQAAVSRLAEIINLKSALTSSIDMTLLIGKGKITPTSPTEIGYHERKQNLNESSVCFWGHILVAKTGLWHWISLHFQRCSRVICFHDEVTWLIASEMGPDAGNDKPSPDAERCVYFLFHCEIQ